MKDFVLIPAERKKILNEETIKKIEKETDVKITTSGNTVEIDGEGLQVYQAKNIVRALGRGFSLENALLLLQDKQLEIIALRGKEKNVRVVKSRIIGTKGKTKKMIEQCSGCVMSIYGKTVALIGNYRQIKIAREAIEMFISGSTHSNVYRFLEECKER